MNNPFTKATKTQSRLRCGIMGPSNSGKTWQALTLANALGKTAVIDTENGSASKYADLFGFDVINLTNHHPDEYGKMLDAAASAGYDAVVIDSLTHAWEATQRLVDDEVIRTRGNSFQIWGKVGQVYNRLMQRIIQSPIHVVATMRSKTEYVLEENDRGKKVPRKIGLAPQVRAGAEYEFDVVLECDHENNVWATKSRCPSLNGQTWKKPKDEIASVLKAWLSDGAPVPVQTPPTTGGSNPQIPRPVNEWNDELKAEAGAIRQAIHTLSGEAQFNALWKLVKNYAPQDAIDELGKLRAKLEADHEEELAKLANTTRDTNAP